MFRISDDGIALIKRFEGLRLDAYADVAGIPTIGYGHTGPEVALGQSITEDEADELLRKDIDRFEDGVNNAVNVPITQSMFDALVSLGFNIGTQALKKSTAIRRLKARDYYGAAEAITWWNKARINGTLEVVTGLARRRAAEAALFLSDVGDVTSENDGNDASGAEIKENPPRRDNPIATRTTAGAATAAAAGAASTGAVLTENVREGDGAGRDAGAGDGATPDGTDGTGTTDGTTDTDGGATDPATDGTDTGAGADTGTDTDTDAATGGDADAGADAGAGATDGATTDGTTGATDGGDVDAGGTDTATPDSAGEDAVVADGADTTPTDTPTDAPDGPTDGTTTATEQPSAMPNVFENTDVTDGIVIGAGVLAVLAAIYIVGARIDDWLRFRR